MNRKTVGLTGAKLFVALAPVRFFSVPAVAGSNPQLRSPVGTG